MRQPAWAAYTRLAVVLHISQTRQQAGQARYRPSSAVVLTELGKLFASLLFAWFEVGNLMKREEREAVSGVNLGLGIPVVHITSDVTVSKEEEERLLSSKDDFEDEKLSGMDSQRRSSGDELSNRSELAEDVESSGGVPRSRCASRSVSIAARLARMRREFLSPDLFTLAIPAIFFTFQNNAQYVAAANLSVPAFQVSYQLKIPSTALFSILLLNRKLSGLQWLAIGILPTGVAIIQLASHANTAGNASIATSGVRPMIGMIAVVLACLSSGFSGCYFERRLKAMPSNGRTRKTGLWIRNIQLACFGLAVALIVSVSEYAGTYATTQVPAYWTFFIAGFSRLPCIVVLVQIVGGLLAALAIKYADNVSKTFSASAAIVLTFVASIIFFDYRLTFGVAVGSILVLGATWLYSWESIQADKRKTLEARSPGRSSGQLLQSAPSQHRSASSSPDLSKYQRAST
ncbi:hypothetical protein EMMF5_003979 [Cystobasidiomycetes sp. EMM_F5]